MVKDILIEDGKVKGVVTDKQETFYAPQIAAGVGREGSEWFAGVCSGHQYRRETVPWMWVSVWKSGMRS